MRLQQEDACQALSVMTHLPKHKYELYGGPSLRRVADVLANWGGSLVELLQYVTFSVMAGNADLHGKNISFLHNSNRTISLAPMYDVMCTTHYDGINSGRHDTELGLFIGTRTDILQVTAHDLIDEATSWGMRAATAERTINELANSVITAIDPTRSGLDETIPDSLVERIRDRTRSLLPPAMS